MKTFLDILQKARGWRPNFYFALEVDYPDLLASNECVAFTT